ncbi:PcfJ domain-containing protein [Pseudomonas aeruginosa]
MLLDGAVSELVGPGSSPAASAGGAGNDAVVAVANTWADHFNVNPDERDEFIARYVRRVQEHRFWAVGDQVAGRTHAACRLGEMLFFYDGCTVQVRRLGDRPRPTWSRRSDSMKCEIERWGGQLYTKVQLPSVTPEGAHVGKLVRRLKPVFAKKVACSAVFDSMTTFSKAYRAVAYQQVTADVGSSGLALEKSPDCRYTRPRLRFYMRLGAGTFKRFFVFLNQDILRTVRGVGCPSFTLYNWIAAGDVDRRIQAVRAYPLLVPYILLQWEQHKHAFLKTNAVQPFGMHAKSMRLGELVDKGEKILPLLAEAYSWPERWVKSASAFPLRHTGSALRMIGQHGWDDMLSPVIRATGLGNRKPNGKSEWAVWFRFLEALPWALMHSVDEGDWARFLAGCPEWSAPEWEEILPRCRDLGDLNFDDAGFGHDDLGLPKLPAWPLRRYLNLSAQWHKARDELVRKLAKEDEEHAAKGDYAWARMLPENLVHESTGVEIVELTVPEELYLEGRALHHCVDGYSSYCYAGHSRIVSFRKNGKSLATAEFCLRPWKEKPSLRNLYFTQFRGSRNAVVPQASDAGKAFAWLLKQIRARKVPAEVIWPSVPEHLRPLRMRDRDEIVKSAMRRWVASRLRDI